MIDIQETKKCQQEALDELEECREMIAELTDQKFEDALNYHRHLKKLNKKEGNDGR